MVWKMSGPSVIVSRYLIEKNNMSRIMNKQTKNVKEN